VPFSSLRSENSLIDVFFQRRQDDPEGGEGGERVSQIKSKPAFKLTYGRTRGATWFDRTRPPQAIVWLLGAEWHDDRHKGHADAYDILGGLDAAGTLFPREVDLDRLELDRRIADSTHFADDARRDSREVIEAAVNSGRAEGRVAGVPCRILMEKSGELVALFGAVSQKPVVGERSGYEFPLTNDRFLLLAEAMRQAAEDVFGPEVLVDQDPRFPGSLFNERAFVILFEAPNK
jgi:hypothetical protein